MIEALGAGGLIVIVTLVAWLAPTVLLWCGGILAGVGLVASSWCGVIYHVRLRAVIARSSAPVRFWWWAPSRFHAELAPPDRAAVLKWFRAGAVMFGFCAGGLFLVACAVVKALLLMK